MMSAEETALEALRLGLSPLPPMENGSKRPLADIPDGFDDKGEQQWTWTPYQTTPATREHVQGWFKGGRASIGLACGYADVECFEFDCRDTYEAFLDQAGEAGLSDLVDRIRTGYEEFTPSGGVHWLYYCDETRPNTKLAERVKPSDATKRDVLIETRGDGGFIIIAPSNGKVHPTGGAYKLVSGGLRSISTLLSVERDELWEFARSFDEIEAGPSPDPPPFKTKAKGGQSIFPDEGKSPGDDYAERMSWADILEPAGWVVAYTKGDATYWRRPGKNHGSSARTGGKWKGMKVWSTSTSLLTDGTHSKFGVYAYLKHQGDFKTATIALAAAGFGTWIDNDGTERQYPVPIGWKRTNPSKAKGTQPGPTVEPEYG